MTPGLAPGVRFAEEAEVQVLRVIATGVYEHVLNDLAEPFEAQSRHVLRIIITNAGGVIAKLEAGEAADVVMTSSVGIDALAAKGHVVAASKVDVGGMRLGIAVKAGAPPPPDISTAEALREALRGAAAVASIDPHGGATSGPYIDKLFERLGVAAEVRARGVPCKTGGDVGRAVVSGRATLGLTQAAELIGVEGLSFAGFLPEELQLVTVYSAAVASGSQDPATAAAFIAFVTIAGAERLCQSGWEAAPSGVMPAKAGTQ
jgi:molybdate transport system substrate-binding protein